MDSVLALGWMARIGLSVLLENGPFVGVGGLE
jgi:hypothetical protein